MLAVSPCLTAFKEAVCLPSAVFGPGDLAPLARAAWILRKEDAMGKPLFQDEGKGECGGGESGIGDWKGSGCRWTRCVTGSCYWTQSGRGRGGSAQSQRS